MNCIQQTNNYIKKYNSNKSGSLNRLKKPSSQQSGFTLVELLIVIIVIAILAAITIVAYNGITGRAHVAALQANLVQAAKQLETINATNGGYPSPTDANLKFSDSVTPNYYPSGTTSYCLDASSGSTSYVVTNTNQTPVLGSCTTTGLVGWWKFDGNTADSTTNGNNGTILGGVTLTTGEDGKTNSAYNFDGSTGYITIGNSSVFNTPNLTLSAWVKPASMSAVSQEIMAKELQYKYRLTNGGGVGVLLASAGTAWTSLPVYAANITAGTWYNIVIAISSFDGSMRAYVNGAQVGTTSSVTPITAYNANPLYIGSFNTAGAEPFGGSMDDVRFYGRALSAGEVQALYNAGAQ